MINNADEARNLLEQLKKRPGAFGLFSEMYKMEISGQSGGGLVKVTVNGMKVCQSIKIDPALCKRLADDPEFVEDLIRAAFNDAGSKVEKQVGTACQKAGSLQIPPLLQDF